MGIVRLFRFDKCGRTGSPWGVLKNIEVCKHDPNLRNVYYRTEGIIPREEIIRCVPEQSLKRFNDSHLPGLSGELLIIWSSDSSNSSPLGVALGFQRTAIEKQLAESKTRSEALQSKAQLESHKASESQEAILDKALEAQKKLKQTMSPSGGGFMREERSDFLD